MNIHSMSPWTWLPPLIGLVWFVGPLLRGVPKYEG